jgi:hypothetical protein
VGRSHLVGSAAFLTASIIVGCAHVTPASSRHPFQRLSKEARLSAIRRAQVWRATAIPSLDIKAGPPDKKGFAPNTTVSCTYVDRKPTGGRSPKFTCAITPDDEVKVKYGQTNGEVYGEVAASRLLWALGFGADHMYPVAVECRDCPADPARDSRDRRPLSLFNPAAIERKMPGEVMESAPDSGWSWQELDLVSESAGGAPRAHRDALKLLAVLLQHTDTKSSQQRLVCLSEKPEDGRCAEPFMMINDVGLTFGRGNRFNSNSSASVNFEQWTKTPVWQGPAGCIGNIRKSMTGTLDRPVISEAGRAFLADLLAQLSDGQLRDLFEVSQFPLRSAGVRPGKPMTTTDQWVEAFKQKRNEIAGRSCPAN